VKVYDQLSSKADNPTDQHITELKAQLEEAKGERDKAIEYG